MDTIERYNKGVSNDIWERDRRRRRVGSRNGAQKHRHSEIESGVLNGRSMIRQIAYMWRGSNWHVVVKRRKGRKEKE